MSIQLIALPGKIEMWGRIKAGDPFEADQNILILISAMIIDMNNSGPGKF